MALKSPGILTFMLSVILTVLALVTYFSGATIPYITGQEFWVLLMARDRASLRLHHAGALEPLLKCLPTINKLLCDEVP